jgi:hypothetical protein
MLTIFFCMVCDFFIALHCIPLLQRLTKKYGFKLQHLSPLSKMSRYKISRNIGAFGDVGIRTSTAKKKIDASKSRLFRISIMSCACLLMNTAATLSMAVVLEDWSVSSGLWLTCTVSEEPLTRNWAAYGLNNGSRLNCFFPQLFPQRSDISG